MSMEGNGSRIPARRRPSPPGAAWFMGEAAKYAARLQSGAVAETEIHVALIALNDMISEQDWQRAATVAEGIAEAAKRKAFTAAATEAGVVK